MDTEKITLNMTPVDLGKIDLVVSQGVFSTRTDFMRTAIRRLLDEHEPLIKDVVARQYWSIGAEVLGRRDLERARGKGERLRIRVVGMLALSKEITPELADEVIEEVRVFGVTRMPKAVRERLGSKVRQRDNIDDP